MDAVKTKLGQDLARAFAKKMRENPTEDWEPFNRLDASEDAIAKFSEDVEKLFDGLREKIGEDAKRYEQELLADMAEFLLTQGNLYLEPDFKSETGLCIVMMAINGSDEEGRIPVEMWEPDDGMYWVFEDEASLNAYMDRVTKFFRSICITKTHADKIGV